MVDLRPLEVRSGAKFRVKMMMMMMNDELETCRKDEKTVHVFL